MDVPRDSTLGKSELQVAVRTATQGMVGIRVHRIHPLVECTQAHLPAYPHGPRPGSRAVMSLNSPLPSPFLPLSPSSWLELCKLSLSWGMLPVWGGDP